MRAGPSAILSGAARCAALLLGLTLGVVSSAFSGEWTSTIVESFDPDTVTSVEPPLAYFDPIDLQIHIAHLINGAIRHTWGSGETWTSETVAPAARLLDLAVGRVGWAAMAYVDDAGVLMCARHRAADWVTQPVTDPGTEVIDASLAVDPVTEQPVVALLTRPHWPHADLVLADRTEGVWRSVVLDTAANIDCGVSLAIDLCGRPRIVYSRRPTPQWRPEMLTFAEAPAIDSSFTATIIDTLAHAGPLWVPSFGQPSLALDPLGLGPRLVYGVGRAAYYAYRMPGGEWRRNPQPFLQVQPLVLSLALDDSGNPSIALSFTVPMQPHDAADARSITRDCGAISCDIASLLEREGGAGDGAFGLHLLGESAWVSRRAVFARHARQPEVIWRGGESEPYRVSIRHGVYVALADVRREEGSAPALVGPVPNPLRCGEAIGLRLTLDRAALVTVDLVDLAGRRLARRSAEPLERGAHELRWTPPVTRPGLHWLQVRAGDTTLGTRALVVIR